MFPLRKKDYRIRRHHNVRLSRSHRVITSPTYTASARYSTNRISSPPMEEAASTTVSPSSASVVQWLQLIPTVAAPTGFSLWNTRTYTRVTMTTTSTWSSHPSPSLDKTTISISSKTPISLVVSTAVPAIQPHYTRATATISAWTQYPASIYSRSHKSTLAILASPTRAFVLI